MQIPLIQIDAFAEHLFEGNPAAVMPLQRWLDDAVLQNLGTENNLSETAFYTHDLPAGVQSPAGYDGSYHLRWFTPSIEVDLCGHATLAAAAQIFEDVLSEDARRIAFWTRTGWLYVERGGSRRLIMNFPTEPLVPAEIDPVVAAALGIDVLQTFRATDLVCLADSADTVRSIRPDFSVLSGLDVRGVIVTAPGAGTEYDFVSRWFGARAGIAEDPVTGSAHSQIAAYWAHRLGRNELTARQLSARGGTVWCTVRDNRVLLEGSYRRYLDGIVHLPD